MKCLRNSENKSFVNFCAVVNFSSPTVIDSRYTIGLFDNTSLNFMSCPPINFQGGATCVICEFVMKELDSMLTKNSTEVSVLMSD